MNNTINPVSVKASYTQNDIIDFNLTFEGKSVVRNSIRIIGEININNGTNNLPKNKAVYFDSVAGIHGVWQSITCSSDNQGVVETNNQYPRYVKSKTQASMMTDQISSMTPMLTELRIGKDELVPALMAQSSVDNTGYVGVGENYTSFSMKPDVALNKSSGNIGFNKSGQLYISLRCATNGQFLYGSDASGYSYKLRNIQLQYMTVNGNTSEKINMESIYSIKNTVESNNAQLSTTVPAIVQSVSCVFHEDATLNSTTSNNLENEMLPDVERVDFSFNDNNDAYIAYQLKYTNEILYNYQESWGFDKKNNFSLEKLATQGRGFGIGLNFKQLVDLSNQSFGLNIVSNVTSSRKYAIFMIFRAMVEM